MLQNLGTLPSSPGVYIFRGSRGQILYIGKASNLKNRVSSYFQPSTKLSPRIAAMVPQISKVELKETEGEIPALLLEAQLVQKYQPPYNVKLKDDKNAYYLIIDYSYDFPAVKLARTVRNNKTEAFGPYPETNVTWAVKTIRQMFPWRDCGRQKFNRYAKLGRACLSADVGLCPAPCVDRVKRSKYLNQLNLLKQFLKGKKNQVVRTLKKDMRQAAQKQDYEKAAYLRDQISRIERMVKWKSPVEFSADTTGREHRTAEAVEELQQLLAPIGLVDLSRIEAYDISNLQGQYATGSMVVFTSGRPDKSEYRRFRIKHTSGPNDPAMMAEVIKRRLKRWPQIKPDLILADGGKGQVSAVLKVLKKEEISIPVIGLAKREEMVVVPTGDSWTLIKLPKESGALQLLQNIRDESHRFALAYHRKLRRTS